MFRLILIHSRKPFELSTITSSICSKVSIHRSLRENNYAIIGPLNDSGVFQYGTKQFLFDIDELPSSTFAHHYTTKATAMKSDRSNSLDHFIKKLKDRVSGGNHLTHKDIKTLSQFLKTQKASDDQALNILQLCSFGCIDRNTSELFKNIWNELKQGHVQFNIEHFNCLLRFTSKKKDVIQTQQIFDELIADDLQPDSVSYDCLLSVYCSSGNIEKAREILNMMRQNNILVSECSSNYLIQCHIICGNIDAAYEEIENLNKHDFEMSRDTLLALLSHYAKTGNVKNVEKTIAVFNAKKLELLNCNILKVLCESAVNGHSELVESLLQQLKQNAELNTALQNAIPQFVRQRQSAILPRIFQLYAETDTKQMYTHLINEMVQHCTCHTEFNETIKLIEANGFPLEINFEIFKPALKSCSKDMIQRLLRHMKTHRIDVTEMAFVKLFQLASKNGIDDVINVLNLMYTEFRIQLQLAYFRDVIMPALNTDDDPTVTLAHLRKTKIPERIAVKALINSHLNRYDFKTVIDFMNRYDHIFYGINFITMPLLKAYANTGDVENFVQIVKIIERSFSQIRNYCVDTVLSDVDVRTKRLTFIGNMLYSSIEHTLYDVDNLKKLLETFVAEKLRTNTNQIMKIQNELLKLNAQSSIVDLLKKLSIEEVRFELKNLKQNSNQHDRTSAELEIMFQRATGATKYEVRKRLFYAYIREGNVEKVESMLKKYDLTITQANYAKLIELYANVGNLEMALKLLQEVCLKDQSFKLDPPKVIQIVTLMVENNLNFDEIEIFLYTHRPQKSCNRMISCEIFLQRIAADGNAHLLDQLFDALVRLNYITATVHTTGPLISVRLNNAAYSDAVDKFEYLAKTYKTLPMSIILFKELIRNNQMDLLQRVYNTYVMICGESEGASRLAFAFSDCGLDEKAKQILQNGRIVNLTKYVRKRCKKYFDSDDIQSAKFLLKSTQGSSCDRRIIYQTILDIYYKENMANDALELWNEFANENVLPPYNFINKLNELLKANNIEIPKDLQLNSKQTNH